MLPLLTSPLPLRYVQSLPYVILTRRTAVTRRVERRIVRAGVKTNPHSLAEEFLEDKAEALSSLQAQVYGMHVWAQAKQAGQQLTIEQMMMALSARSRTTSISNSFQPSKDSSINTSVVGDASSPPATMAMNSSRL